MTKLFFFFNVNLIPYIHGHFFVSLQSLSEVFYIIQSCEVDLKIFPYNIISYFLCPNDMEWLGKVYLLLLFGTLQRNCELQLETFPQALCNQPDYIFSEIREEREGKVMWKSFFFIKWNEVKLLSCVRLFATPWTVAYQAPPSMGFSRQEYWHGVFHFLLQRIFPTQGLNPGLPHCRQTLYCLSHQGSLFFIRGLVWQISYQPVFY